MSDIIFIGELPPPYGGVAVKDKLVFREVYQELGAEMIDLVECKRHPSKIPFIFGKIICGMLSKKISSLVWEHMVGERSSSKCRSFLEVRRD